VDHTWNWPASVSTRLPVVRRDSVERFPLTGWSRLAIQTTVSGERVYHIAKQKAFSPTA